MNSTQPIAVIAGAFQTGVLSVRNLKRRGVKALCFDSNSGLQGFRSVYGPARLCPDSDEDPDGWIEFMIELGTELDKNAVLIPSSDKYVSAIARYRDVLGQYFAVSPGIEVQGLLAEKQTQYQMAIDNGMPMPKTAMIDGLVQLEAFCDEATYPCLLKPWHFRQWERLPEGNPLRNQKVAIGSCKDELASYYMHVQDVSPNLIGQEIIEGPDTSKRVYLSCYDKDGKRIANAMFRELRCAPFGFGPASVSEPVVDDEADEICNDFLKRIGYRGICEIEVKRDSRDGKVKLIEANPRLSGGGDAAPYAGVDLVWIHYQDMIGLHVDAVRPNNRMFKHVVLRAEGKAIPEYMRAGLLSWRGLVRCYMSRLAFFDLDWRDWRISLESILVFLRLLVTKGLLRR